jgi:cAMP-dependent protein kinase regulator
VFNALDVREMEVVIGAMEEKRCSVGEIIIRQGDEGDNLYVVESGQLTCVRKFVSGYVTLQASGEEPKFLKEYQPGEAFGELALLYNAPRAATITAKTEAVLWSLDRPTFTNIVKDAAMYVNRKPAARSATPTRSS